VPDLPNILYIHSHDTGLWVRPYGYSVRTPNIQWLAEEGVLFRKAFYAAPTCSGSRACLLTGLYTHFNGSALPRGCNLHAPTVPTQTLRSSEQRGSPV
jgi:arylsulfatase A-like enzyme